MPEEEARLTELLDAITERLRDAMRDLEAAVRCIQAYKADPKGAQSCILEYLRTGTTVEKLKGV